MYCEKMQKRQKLRPNLGYPRLVEECRFHTKLTYKALFCHWMIINRKLYGELSINHRFFYALFISFCLWHFCAAQWCVKGCVLQKLPVLFLAFSSVCLKSFGSAWSVELITTNLWRHRIFRCERLTAAVVPWPHWFRLFLGSCWAKCFEKAAQLYSKQAVTHGKAVSADVLWNKDEGK